MPRTSSDTRRALYLAGLRRFANEGWQSARIRDIVADAGQGNDSAINYHFGSRSGLLAQILADGVARMEGERRADQARWRTDPPDLPEAVRAVVAPLADLLLDEEGRCTLRVIAQVGPLTEVGRTITAGPVGGTVLQDQLEVLVSETARRCGTEMARHRVRQLVVVVTSDLAARAEAAPDSFPPHREYVADLVDWMSAGLGRPRVCAAVGRPGAADQAPETGAH
ncbi:hypothetical protein NCCP2495_27380 [Dietzia sp. NCCP-2495]|uniref:TetR/AcrR family transcriptional regulator n=1 Tax=Dietzia sp. NCCP-2495 TaxID=2934675 RepID=UPI002230B5C8|nr:hypothetical protein [Dietzia sp. NCCP-2495]GLB64858.1 hypothetical protein NCCP2495_27380 [Dietzia sp. NCCP-2495]